MLRSQTCFCGWYTWPSEQPESPAHNISESVPHLRCITERRPVLVSRGPALCHAEPPPSVLKRLGPRCPELPPAASPPPWALVATRAPGSLPGREGFSCSLIRPIFLPSSAASLEVIRSAWEKKARIISRTLFLCYNGVGSLRRSACPLPKDTNSFASSMYVCVCVHINICIHV